MALGVLKDEATYYENNEKYTGRSGSSTNMYIIEDVYDFVGVLKQPATIGDSYYIRLINDIDFNDHSTYKRGISSAIYDNNNYYLYGDNHKIKNIVVINATSNILKFQHIEKVDFVNLVAVNCSVFPVAMVNAENCDFGIFVSNSFLSFTVYNTDIKIIDCTFNIKGKTKTSGLICAYRSTFQACHFNVDVNVPFSNGTYIFTIGMNDTRQSTYVNCYFTGKINNSGSSSIYFAERTQFTNCYFALEWAGSYYEHTHNGSTFSSCFVDKELFNKNGNNWLSLSGVAELTTAQAQDAEYLNSIGFLVISVE